MSASDWDSFTANQWSTLNAKGNRYTYLYDVAGQKTQMIDPLGRRTTSLYDAAGQKTTRIDAKGVRTSYTYNPNSQVLSRKYPDGTRATFSYDSRGNRTLSENGDIRTTTTYDAANRPLSVTTHVDAASKTIGYTYDPVGNWSKMIDPDGGRFSYAYDANQQLKLIRNPQ